MAPQVMTRVPGVFGQGHRVEPHQSGNGSSTLLLSGRGRGAALVGWEESGLVTRAWGGESSGCGWWSTSSLVRACEPEPQSGVWDCHGTRGLLLRARKSDSFVYLNPTHCPSPR